MKLGQLKMLNSILDCCPYQRFMPMLMTAARTFKGARMLIMGLGVVIEARLG